MLPFSRVRIVVRYNPLGVEALLQDGAKFRRVGRMVMQQFAKLSFMRVGEWVRFPHSPPIIPAVAQGEQGVL